MVDANRWFDDFEIASDLDGRVTAVPGRFPRLSKGV
jgi:hypothetical protein